MSASGEQLERFLESLPEGFTYGVHERLAVNQLLLSLAERGEFPEDPRALKTLLAPLVCSSRDQQQELYQRFEKEWRLEPPPAESAAPKDAGRRRIPWWLGAEAIVLILVMAAGATTALKWIETPVQVLELKPSMMPTPPVPAYTVITGTVVSDTGRPVADAEVWIAGESQHTGANGSFLLTAPASSDPVPILAAHPDYQAEMTTVANGTSAVEIKLQPLTASLPRAGDLTQIGDAQSFLLADPTDTIVDPNGYVAATRGRSRVVRWNLSDRSQIDRAPPGEAIGPDDHYRISFDANGVKVQEYRPASGVLLSFEPAIQAFQAFGYSFPTTIDAQLDRSSRYAATRMNGQAVVFDTATGQRLNAPVGWPTSIIGFGFSNTADRLTLAAVDPTLLNRLRPLRWLAAVLPAAAVGIWLFWIYRTRARLRRLSLPVELDTYALKAPPAEPPFHDPHVRRLGLEMRRRKAAPSLDLAIEPTVRATVRSAGFLTPVYAARTLQREFLILVQKADVADQQERLYQALAETLRVQGALIDLYTFRSTPERIRDPQTGGWLDIEELAARHPHHDLWMVADPADFPAPYTLVLPQWISALSRWQDRAVLSPVAVDSRLRAMLDAEGLRVGTASTEGFAAMLWIMESDRAMRPGQEPDYPDALRQLPLRWVERSSPGDAAIGALLPELDAYLGPEGVLLAGACSVYPETLWPLTLWLAVRLIPDAARRDAVLTRLTILPWFRYGRIPDWMRAQLVNQLGPHTNAVRQAIEEFLEKAERAGKTGEGDLAIAREDRGAKGQLRDYVMFSFLLGRKVDEKLAVKPPSAWLRLLFEGGRFVFGPRLWIYAAAAVVFGLGVWAASGAALALVPSRVIMTQWKLPEPVQVPPPRTFPDDPLRRAIVEVADSMVGQTATSVPEAKVVAQAMRFVDGDRGASRPVETRNPVAGLAYNGGFIESVSGDRALVIESQSGRIQRLERALPSGPFREYLYVNLIDGLAYEWIPPGKFRMGCSPGDKECDSDEDPTHDVTITRGFRIGQTEVTQEAYQKVMGQKNPSHFKGAKLPVESVTWDEAQAYCKAIGGHLPTEAEWEYAARAGNPNSRYGDLDSIAWYSGNSGDTTHEVGQKAPNAWGLYDTLGNVFEWTLDWYDKYPANSETDPRGPASGEYRVLRGGSWDYVSTYLRAAYRYRYLPDYRVDIVGFRCVREVFP